MSLIFPINDIYKEKNNNINNNILSSNNNTNITKIITTSNNQNSEKTSLQEIFSSRNELFLNEYYKLQNLHFSATCFVRPHLLYHEGRILVTDKKLLVIKKTTKKNLFKNSKQRKKNLTQQKLEQYNISHPIVSLDFDLISARLITYKSQKKFNIIILGNPNLNKPTSTIYFSMSNSSEKLFSDIIKLISKSIFLSSGFKYNLFGVSMRKFFYRDYFIKINVFEEIAKTGDILLFKGFQKHSKCQRTFTRADYDHVALLVRQGTILYVFESTGNDGVKLRNWKDFRINLWNLLYDKISFRQILIDKEIIKNVDEFMKNNNVKCNEFIKMTKGLKYTLSGCGFCCKCSMKKYGKNKKWGDFKGYFCSQLVAAAYNHMGLLTNDIDVGYYLPGNFSRDYDLELKKGIELSVEYIIDFTE
jgi:hypothetical protein